MGNGEWGIGNGEWVTIYYSNPSGVVTNLMLIIGVRSWRSLWRSDSACA